MPQRVPSVSRADVERVVRRDFPSGRWATVFGTLDGYVSGSGSPHRVQLAALKLSSGDLDSLREWIEQANLDPRDVLVAAEYPSAFSRWQAIALLSDDEREGVYDADWRQYQRWLQRS